MSKAACDLENFKWIAPYSNFSPAGEIMNLVGGPLPPRAPGRQGGVACPAIARKVLRRTAALRGSSLCLCFP